MDITDKQIEDACKLLVQYELKELEIIMEKEKRNSEALRTKGTVIIQSESEHCSYTVFRVENELYLERRKNNEWEWTDDLGQITSK